LNSNNYSHQSYNSSPLISNTLPNTLSNNLPNTLPNNLPNILPNNLPTPFHSNQNAPKYYQQPIIPNVYVPPKRITNFNQLNQLNTFNQNSYLQPLQQNYLSQIKPVTQGCGCGK